MCNDLICHADPLDLLSAGSSFDVTEGPEDNMLTAVLVMVTPVPWELNAESSWNGAVVNDDGSFYSTPILPVNYSECRS